MLFTVEGFPFPSVFHANYHLSPKGVNYSRLGLDKCKLQLIVTSGVASQPRAHMQKTFCVSVAKMKLPILTLLTGRALRNASLRIT